MEKIACAVAPGASRTRRRRLKIGSSTEPAVFESGRPSITDDRRPHRPAAAEEAGAIRLVLDDAGRAASSTAATWAAQIGGSSRDRGRRVASSAPMSGANSVCTNRFWNAGWATSAACGARAISA